jgi:hypothetical protein
VNSNHPAINHVAIVGNYALAYWTEGPIGGAVLASYSSGSWQMISHVKGGYAVVDLLGAAPQMGPPTAQVLFNQVQLGKP